MNARIKEALENHKLWLDGKGLYRAAFQGEDLREVDFQGVTIHGIDFRGADLWGAKGIYQFGPMPTSGRICYAVWHVDHWKVQAGCFWGTLDKLEEKVKASHNCPVYLAQIALLRGWKYEDK